MDPGRTQIGKLEKSNSYIIEYEGDFLVIVTILEKFENSSMIRIESGEFTGRELIFPEWKEIYLYDHVPVKYMRKKKLDKIEKL